MVAGVQRRPESERSAALGVLAREMLARQATGLLTIDPNLQGAVEQAAAG